jgi:hypothetical protein
MTDRDSDRPGGAATRRGTPAGRTSNDSPEVVESRVADGPAPSTEAQYASRTTGRPPPEPLKVRVELVVADGTAAKELLKRQAMAVREALQWFADHPPDHEGTAS